MVIRAGRRLRKYYKQNFVRTTELTQSELDKLATLRKLDALTAEVSSKEYHDGVVALEAHEIPSVEFLPKAKRKRRWFEQEIGKLSHKKVTADEARRRDMLKKRSAAHEEILNARIARENTAKQRAGLIQGYIGELVSIC